MPATPIIETKEFPFLVHALKSRSKDLKMPGYALLIGAGCSYRSGIPLGGQVTELLKMECFKRDKISDYRAEFPIKPGFKFEEYQEHFKNYISTTNLENTYHEYLKEKDAVLKNEVDALTEQQKKAIIPPSLLTRVANDKHSVFIEKWFDEHKAPLYQDYAYGFWFMQFSASQRDRSELLETLIEDRSTGYGYTCLANAINTDYIRNIFTTNFDDLVNDALSQYFFKNSRIIAHAELAEHINFHNHNPNIIKLHGDYLFADLRNTQSEINANPLTVKMKDAFRDFGVIVIGYGGADYAIMSALEQAKTAANPYSLIWCDRKEPEQLHWRVKNLLQNTRNSFYIPVENFDVLMVQISEALNLKPPDMIGKAQEKQKEFDRFYGDAKIATQASSLSNEKKAQLDQELTASEYFSKAASAKTPDEKIAYYTRAIHLKPDYINAYNNRGNAWGDKKEYDKAIDDYSKVIELNPNDTDAYNNRGLAWNDKNEQDKAIADFCKAIELKPDYGEVYYNRGLVWIDKKDYDKAIADYSKAIELMPDDEESYYNRALAWGYKEEYDRAIADYTRAIELKPDDAEAYGERGLSWSYKKEYDKAIADYSRAIELKPDDAEAYYNRGLFWRYKNEFDTAIADYNKAIELDPDYVNAYINRGLAWMHKTEYAKAIKDFLTAENMKEGSASYNFACLYSLTSEKAEALKWLEKALQLKDNSRGQIEADADFDNIRDLPEYKQLLDKYRPVQ